MNLIDENLSGYRTPHCGITTFATTLTMYLGRCAEGQRESARARVRMRIRLCIRAYCDYTYRRMRVRRWSI